MTITTHAPRARTRALVATGLALAIVGSAVPAGAQVRAETIVTVFDEDGEPVVDVEPGDFTVREDGQTREILEVTAAPPPSHLVVLVDDSQATNGLTTELRSGLQTFVDLISSVGQTPTMRLATFGARTTTHVEFTTSPALVMAGIERIFPQPGTGATFLEAVRESAVDLADQETSRPAIVAFVAEAGAEFSEDSHQRIADVLRQSGVSLWTVVLQDRFGQPDSTPARERAIVLGDVAGEGGGMTWPVVSREGITGAFIEVAAALTSSYTIAYGRPDALVPPSDREVTVADESLEVVFSEWASP